jgi:hypothetical protein
MEGRSSTLSYLDDRDVKMMGRVNTSPGEQNRDRVGRVQPHLVTISQRGTAKRLLIQRDNRRRPAAKRGRVGDIE